MSLLLGGSNFDSAGLLMWRGAMGVLVGIRSRCGAMGLLTGAMLPGSATLRGRSGNGLCPTGPTLSTFSEGTIRGYWFSLFMISGEPVNALGALGSVPAEYPPDVVGAERIMRPVGTPAVTLVLAPRDAGAIDDIGAVADGAVLFAVNADSVAGFCTPAGAAVVRIIGV